MSKLINAYFSRLFTWTIYRILILLMVVAGIVAGIILRKEGMVWNAPYMVAYLLFPHYLGVVIGLFNYPLFTSGTIRNQLSVGHDRRSVFFADWAASNLFAVALYLIFAACMFAVPLIFGNTRDVAGSTAAMGQLMMEDAGETVIPAGPVSTDVSANAVAAGVALSCLHIILFSTITQLFCVILKGVKSFLAIFLGNQALILAGVGISVLVSRKEIPEKLLCLFPTAMCMRLSSFAVDPLLLPSVIAAAAEASLVFIIGLVYFCRTDIN